MLLKASCFLFVHFLLSELFDSHLGQVHFTIILDDFRSFLHLKISAAEDKHQEEAQNANDTIRMKENELIDNILIDVVS